MNLLTLVTAVFIQGTTLPERQQLSESNIQVERFMLAGTETKVTTKKNTNF